MLDGLGEFARCWIIFTAQGADHHRTRAMDLTELRAMDLTELSNRAWALRERYAELETQRHGRPWPREEVALGFVGDVGDLMKLVQAAEGMRAIPDARAKLEHELADCLWSVLVLARLYDVDLEAAFERTLGELDKTVAERLRSGA